MQFNALIITLIVSFFAPSIAAKEAEIDRELKYYIAQFKVQTPKKYNKKIIPLYELGRELFNSRKLSLAGDISCAHCHQVNKGTGDGLPLSLGTGASGDIANRVQGKAGVTTRNAPALWNRSTRNVKHHFWDGRVSYNKTTGIFISPSELLTGKNPILEDIANEMINAASVQAMFPPTSTLEMKGPLHEGESHEVIWNAIVENLRSEKNLLVFFELAFPGVARLNMGHVGKAIAHFEEIEFFVDDTPLDAYMSGELDALSEREKKGAILFMDKARCTNCHSGENFSDQSFHNILIADVGMNKEPSDLGRFDVTGDEDDKYKFLTPGLRNIALSAPYMHNGIIDNLEEVVSHYQHPMRTLMHFEPSRMNKKYGKFYNGNFVRVWEREKVLAQYQTRSALLPMNLGLSSQERSDLVCFLKKSLTSYKFQSEVGCK